MTRGRPTQPLDPAASLPGDPASWRIPLPSRTGIARFAIVSEVDVEAVSAHRWHLTAQGYAATDILNAGHRITTTMHRFIAARMGRQISGLVVHHHNSDRIDNRRDNLLVCTQAENMAHLRKEPAPTANSSPTKARGVTWDATRKRWVSQIEVAGKTFFLGRYSEEARAATAYKLGRRVRDGLLSPGDDIEPDWRPLVSRLSARLASTGVLAVVPSSVPRGEGHYRWSAAPEPLPHPTDDALRLVPLCGKRAAGKQAVIHIDSLPVITGKKWHLNAHGYAYHNVRVNGRNVGTRMSRAIMDAPDGDDVDHIDGDRLNNDVRNLRLLGRAENRANTHNADGLRMPKLERRKTGYRLAFRFAGRYYCSPTFPVPDDARRWFALKFEELSGMAVPTGVDLGAITDAGKTDLLRERKERTTSRHPGVAFIRAHQQYRAGVEVAHEGRRCGFTIVSDASEAVCLQFRQVVAYVVWGEAEPDARVSIQVLRQSDSARVARVVARLRRFLSPLQHAGERLSRLDGLL